MEPEQVSFPGLEVFCQTHWKTVVVSRYDDIRNIVYLSRGHWYVPERRVYQHVE